MTRLHFWITIFILAGGIILKSYATNYYLATNGNNNNNGSINAPWATFVHSLRSIQPGDTIFVRGGTYTEGEIWIRKDLGMGGVDGQYVTIMAYPGEVAKLDGSRRMIVEANYIRIQGLTFINTYSLDFPWWGDPGTREYVEILNNHFTGHFGIPLEFCGNNGLIEGNIIENQNGESHAIYLHYGTNNIIRNNQILGTYKYGIHVYDEHKSEDPPGFVREYHNVIIEQNLITSSGTRAGIILGTSADSPSPGVIIDSVIIRNNVIVDNATLGIYLKAWAGEIKNIEIYNNTIYGNGGDGIYLSNVHNVLIKNNIIVSDQGFHIGKDTQAHSVSIDHNLFWPVPLRLDNVEATNSIVADPIFIDPSNRNFWLQEGSPAIDAGVDMGLPYQGNAPDLGAFEYGIPLSVELKSFNASIKDGTILLSWQTTSESDNYGFNIERSVNGEFFNKIGFVKGKGTTSSKQNYEYADGKTIQGNSYYRLKILNLNGGFKYSPVIEVDLAVPTKFNLKQNFPNPFNSNTIIKYSLHYKTNLNLVIFNSQGREVVTLAQEEQLPGQKIVIWKGQDNTGNRVTSGIYFINLVADNFRSTKKMLLIN